MGAVYIDRIPASKRVGGQLNVSFVPSVITDALVAANATVTALKAAITAAVVRPDLVPVGIATNDALDLGVSLSLIPETHSCTTVAQLVALTDASSTFKQGIRG